MIEWLYDAGGAKLQKKTISNAVVGLTLDYLGGNFEYRNDTLDAIYLTDAKLVLDKGTPKEYQYYLRDNVQNNRLVFRDSLGIPVLVNQSHYYPNGGLMVGAWQQDKKTKYLYNGIERVNDFSLDIYHAKYRTLDQWTGRWWQVDPEVEQFYAWSPYNQNFGNSVRLSDPNGDCPPWICGAIAGGVVEGGSQYIANVAKGDSWIDAAKNIDGADVLAATVEGGVTGGGSVARRLLIKGTAAVVSEVVQASVDVELDGDVDVIGTEGSDKSVSQVATETAIGIGSAIVGEGVGGTLKAITNNKATKELTQVNRELKKASKGSKGEAVRLSKQAGLSSTINGNKVISEGTGTATTEVLDEKLKSNQNP